jgi:hypothetical protein
MRASLRLIVTLSLLVVGAPHAYAQRRVPATGMWGLGGSLGGSAPSDPSLQNGLDFTGNLEHYLTPRVSIRGQVGASWWDIQGRHFTGTVTPFFATGNVAYNWEGGVVHPFVTGGLGVYRFHASESGTQDQSDTKPGFNLGGGLESRRLLTGVRASAVRPDEALRWR